MNLSGSSRILHSLLIAPQYPILILRGLFYIFGTILYTILHLVGSLLVTISFGSLQELLGRYFSPAYSRIEHSGISRISMVEKMIAILRLKERELAAHCFPLSPSRHPFPPPHKGAIRKSVRIRAHLFDCSNVGGLGDWKGEG